MTKVDFIEQVAVKTQMTKRSAEAFADLVFDLVRAELVNTGRFVWPAFGVFNVVEYKARNVRRPPTPYQSVGSPRDIMQIPASKTVRFRAGKNLKAVLK